MKMRFMALVLGLVVGRAALAETTTVEVEGVAAVVKDDVAIARDRALDDARRKAVEQVVGAVVSSETLSENFQIVEDRIFARASGFVKTYEILSEQKEEGVYRVRVRAVVDQSDVAEHVEQIFRVKPRVILLIAEQNIGAKNFSYWWGSSGFVSDMDILQTSLMGAWQPKGFKFVDPGLLKGKLKIKGAMRNAGLSDEGAVTIGRSTDADVAIVGKVLVTDAGPVMDGVKMHTYQAVGTLRALSVDTGEVIAVADETGSAPHVDPNFGGRTAIKALAERLGDDLLKKIMKRWTEEAASAREVELVVQGTVDSGRLKAFEGVVQSEVRGVESMKRRRRAKGRVHYDVRVRARTADFAEDLESKTYPGLKVEVETLTKARLVLKLSEPRGRP
ncbi:MAG: flagellar assembly protein T N-terminal domain-containing protein [Deltaproteobacteria bacterium]|nr:flagellar assembly protein T N-terminal domain-containing protein [Deltaproteobacteria bacterium]